MLMTIADRMLLIGKNFDNEGFKKYLNTLQVACTVFRTAYTNNMHELCQVRHVGKSVLLMHSCF